MNKNLLVVGALLLGLIGGYIAGSMVSGKSQKTEPKGMTTVEKKTYAPLPETAKGPAIPQDKGYLVQEIKDGLYYINDGSYQAMFVVSNQGVIVVNAPASMAQKLLPAIKEVTDQPVTHVVYSVAKADFIAGAGVFPKNAQYIAQEEAANHLQSINADDASQTLKYGIFVGGSNIPLPTVTFKDTLTVTSGNQTLELTYKYPTVSEGNTMVYAPKQKVLLMADLVFPGWVPYKNLVYSKNVANFIQAHDDLLAYDFETYLGGHFRPGTKQDVEVQKEYVTDIRNNVMNALQKVDFMAVAKKTGFENTWLLVGTYLDEIAQKCTDDTEAKWKDRLGGADIFTFNHCDAMTQAVRVD